MKKTYTEELNELHALIEQMSASSDTQAQRAIQKDLKEIKAHLLEQNSSIRENREAILSIAQWREGYVKLESVIHSNIHKTVDETNARVSRWIVGNMSLSAALAAVVVAVKEVVGHLTTP